MTRAAALALTLAMLLTLTACGSASAPAQEDGRLAAPVSSTGEWAGTGGCFNTVEQLVGSFNSHNEDYYIDVVDYSGGTDDAATAINRLNTELISGGGPDIILFDGLDPAPYASKEALLDLYPLIDGDDELSRDLICGAAPLERNGGLYTLATGFFISTWYGFAEIVGERFGWSWDAYFAMQDALPEGSSMLGYQTSDMFLSKSVSGWISRGIDWESGACSFNSPEFIRILEAAKSVYDPNAPDENLMWYDEALSLFAQGKICLSETFLTGPADYARPEETFGHPVSYIGWPTPDGSCGTCFIYSGELGIRAGTEYPEGCWEFVKFVLMNLEAFGFPVYRPALNALVEAACTANADGKTVMTRKQAESLYALIDAVTAAERSDRTVSDIVSEEAAKYFAGDKTAEQTADMIQSRVSLYVAEQAP